jgi:hypothetical protein
LSHPSGAEGAIALFWAAAFTWAALVPILVIAIIGSVIAIRQRIKGTGSTINFVVAALCLAPNALWFALLTLLFFSEMKKRPDASLIAFMCMPGLLGTAACAVWLVLALRARAQRT